MTVLETEAFIDLTKWASPVQAGTGTSSITVSGGIVTATVTVSVANQSPSIFMFRPVPASSTGKWSVRFPIHVTAISASQATTSTFYESVFYAECDATHVYAIVYKTTTNTWFFAQYPSTAVIQVSPTQTVAIPSLSSGTHTVEIIHAKGTTQGLISLYIDDVFVAAILDTTNTNPTVVGISAEVVAASTVPLTDTQTYGALVFADALQAPQDVPNAPILTAHVPIQANASSSLAWTFSDNDGSRTQGAYQVVIRRADTGVTVLDSGQVSSSTPNYTVPSNTLTAGLSYNWTVTTWDDRGVVGPSATSSVIASAVPTAGITYPITDGDTSPITAITPTWTITDPDGLGQSAYQVRLTSSADVQIETTGKVTNTSSRSHTMATTLTNGTTYKVKVTVWNVNGLSSTEVSRTFVVNTAVPQTPTLTVTPNSGGYNAIAITNPTPGGQPAAAYNDIYRRPVGGSFIRIATGVANNATYRDYAAWLGSAAEYEVIAVAASGTSATSAVVSGTLTGIAGLLLHSTADPQGTYIAVQYDEARQQQIAIATNMLQFQGRARPVAEFPAAAYGTDVMTVGLTMLSTDANYPLLLALSQRTDVICYRDQRGRRLFGTFTGFQETDNIQGGYNVQITFAETDYSEAA